MSVYPYYSNKAKFLYKNQGVKYDHGVPKRAKVWWKIELENNSAGLYSQVYEALERVLVGGQRFKVERNSVKEIFQHNYVYLDIIDVIYFINQMKNLLKDPDKVIFNYRML